MNKAIIYAFGVLTGIVVWNAITSSYMKGVKVTYEAMAKKDTESTEEKES